MCHTVVLEYLLASFTYWVKIHEYLPLILSNVKLLLITLVTVDFFYHCYYHISFGGKPTYTVPSYDFYFIFIEKLNFEVCSCLPEFFELSCKIQYNSWVIFTSVPTLPTLNNFVKSRFSYKVVAFSQVKGMQTCLHYLDWTNFSRYVFPTVYFSVMSSPSLSTYCKTLSLQCAAQCAGSSPISCVRWISSVRMCCWLVSWTQLRTVLLMWDVQCLMCWLSQSRISTKVEYLEWIILK